MPPWRQRRDDARRSFNASFAQASAAPRSKFTAVCNRVNASVGFVPVTWAEPAHPIHPVRL